MNISLLGHHGELLLKKLFPQTGIFVSQRALYLALPVFTIKSYHKRQFEEKNVPQILLIFVPKNLILEVRRLEKYKSRSICAFVNEKKMYTAAVCRVQNITW